MKNYWLTKSRENRFFRGVSDFLMNNFGTTVLAEIDDDADWEFAVESMKSIFNLIYDSEYRGGTRRLIAAYEEWHKKNR